MADRFVEVVRLGENPVEIKCVRFHAIRNNRRTHWTHFKGFPHRPSPRTPNLSMLFSPFGFHLEDHGAP